MLTFSLPPEAPPLLRVTCERYHQMVASGALGENDGVELINGFIVTKMPIGPTHGGTVNTLLRAISRKLTDEFVIAVQNPITIHDYSEPEPDLVVAKYRDGCYSDRHPYPEDVLLVIEVADTSLAYDRSAKVPLYAAAGIPEVWLVDIAQRQITVFAQPDGARFLQETVHVGEQVLVLPGGQSLVCSAVLP